MPDQMLITDGILITWEEPNQILEGQALLVEDGLISAIGPQADLLALHPQVRRLEARGQYVMPGNICAHTHFYGAFARGLAIPGAAPKDFPEILNKLWWPLDKSLGEQDICASAEVMLVDAIQHGTTTLIDHHASPNAISGSLDIIAEAVSRSGLRAVLCYEVTDRDGKQKARAGIAENVRFIRKLQQAAHPRLAAAFGMHASLTLSADTLDACRQAAPAGSGFHLHVAEHEVDEYDSLAKSGMRIVDRLLAHDILGPRTIVAHAVHVDARETALLADTGTWVTHQPRSNMNNGVGVADVESLLRSGVQRLPGHRRFLAYDVGRVEDRLPAAKSMAPRPAPHARRRGGSDRGPQQRQPGRLLFPGCSARSPGTRRARGPDLRRLPSPHPAHCR